MTNLHQGAKKLHDISGSAREFVSLTGADQIDRLFSEENVDENQSLVDFAFNEQVVSVFPNMISRSVPRYWEVNHQTSLWAKEYYQENTRIYDLGASLGAASWEIARAFYPQQPPIIAIEQSSAMVKQFRKNLQQSACSNIEIQEGNICTSPIENASVVICNYTLQFISPKQRDTIIQRIYEALVPGGILLLAEKIAMENQEMDRQVRKLHHEWKRMQGYSLTEIEQKSRAIANVMPVDTVAVHERRLKNAGFQTLVQWSQQYNFMALVAQK